MSLCPRCQRPLDDDEPYICCAGVELRWRCADCHKVSEGFAFPYGLCPHCKAEYAPSEIERRLMAITGGTEVKICRSVGCEQCNHIGYRGRLSIMEIVRFDRDMNEALARNSSIGELHTLATAKGFRPLADDGIRRVLSGDTSLEEIARVVDLTERALGVAL